jgi:YD repeat-containing protein
MVVGLRYDGTVIMLGGLSPRYQTEISEWTDIVAVSAGGTHAVGLRADGTVVAVGRDDQDQLFVEHWTDIRTTVR